MIGKHILDCLNRVRSDDADFGSNTDGLVLGSESDESLLLAIRSHQGVDGAGSDVEDVLECFFDLDFVGSVMHQEGEGVLLGHGFVGLLSAKGLDQDGVFVEFRGQLEAGFVVLVLGFGGELESVGFIESEIVSDLVFSSLGSLLGDLGGFGGLADLLGFGGHN